MFKRLVAATELVELCAAPVLAALKIAAQSSARLSILHVLESDTIRRRQVVKDFQSGESIAASAAYKVTVKKEISKRCTDLLKSDFSYKIEVVTGFPWKEILRLARREKSDLILMGPHTERAKELGVIRVKGRIGSTVQGVVMHERCPVMIVNGAVPDDKLEFKSIVVGTDFSESCKNALLFAIKLARWYGAKICLFHMAPIPPCPQYSQADYDRDLKQLQKKLYEFSLVIPEEIEHDLYVWGGALPHVEILKCAVKKNADLIVMGSHTKEESGKWYVGSAVERVSYRSPCPVVVITDPKVLLVMDD